MRKTPTLLVCLAAALLAAALPAQTPTPTPTPTSTPSTPTPTGTPGTPTPTPTPSASPSPTVTATPTATPLPYTTPTGQTYTTQDARAVNASRLQRSEGDTTWFMTPANDRIVRLRGGVMTQWQIRDNDHIGANPVDFYLEGDVIWFIENGQSQITAGKSVVASLDTATGAFREYVFPSSRPAGFYRTPDGKRIWVAQSAGVLESLDLESCRPDPATQQTICDVTDYRVGPSAVFASTLAVGPDSALWVTDFGANRIVRYELTSDPPNAALASVKAWTVVDPSLINLNLSDSQFDEDGRLWLTELTGNRVDRFDPLTAELRAHFGFLNPIHLDIHGGNIYVSERTGSNGSVVILDPRVAPAPTPQTLTAVTQCVPPQNPPGCLSLGNILQSTGEIRDSVITPTDFTPEVAPFAATDLTLTSPVPGLLRIVFNKTNAYGLTAAGGGIWVGCDTNLVRLVAQTIGSPADLTAPVALQAGVLPADGVAVNLTLSNKGTAALSGVALYQYSAGAFPRGHDFSLGPGETAILPDAFVGAATGQALSLGGVRLQVTTGQASDLVASVRSTVPALSWGVTLPAEAQAAALQAGPAKYVLFAGTRTTDITTLGFFSPSGGEAVAELVAPDGTVRGTRSLSLASNVIEFHNPAASYFGVSSEPGDVVRIQVTAGVLQPFVLLQDDGTRDVAAILPVAATGDAVLPGVTSRNEGSTFRVSALYLSNPDATRGATVAATYYPIGGAPVAASVTLPPGGSAAYEDPVTDLFHAPPGQGAIVLSSDAPVASYVRHAARDPASGSELMGAAPALDGAAYLPAGGATAFGVEGGAARKSSLLLFNRGAAATVTLTGYDASGATVGTLALPIAASTAARVDDVFPALGAASTTLGRVAIAPSAGAQIYAQAITFDVPSGDVDSVEIP